MGPGTLDTPHSCKEIVTYQRGAVQYKPESNYLFPVPPVQIAQATLV
jgi:hypothetical protein